MKLSCVLRVFGEHLAIDELLACVPFEPCAVFRKGQARSSRPNARVATSSGANIAVSEAGFDAFAVQIVEAQAFMEQHRDSLRRLASWPGVDYATLDFAIEMRNVHVQSDCFPAALVRLAASLDFGLELSQYPPSTPKKRLKNNRRALQKNG